MLKQHAAPRDCVCVCPSLSPRSAPPLLHRFPPPATTRWGSEAPLPAKPGALHPRAPAPATGAVPPRLPSPAKRHPGCWKPYLKQNQINQQNKHQKNTQTNQTKPNRKTANYLCPANAASFNIHDFSLCGNRKSRNQCKPLWKDVFGWAGFLLVFCINPPCIIALHFVGGILDLLQHVEIVLIILAFS